MIEPEQLSMFTRSVELATNYPREYRLVSGLKASAYMTELEDVNTAMSLLDYKEMFVQAVFATDWAKVQSIVEGFRAQLKSAGIEKFEALVEEKYTENPSTIMFY